MAEAVLEIERKYEAPGRPGMPDLTSIPRVAVAEDTGEDQLDAVYYDTGEFALAVAGITLRRRTGGTDPGWHLKLPAGADARSEIRLPLRASTSVPVQLARLVRAHTRDAPLVPVVMLSSLRQVRRLRDRKGRLLADVSYDEVTAEPLAPAGKKAKRWAEIEVELAEGGNPAFLDAVESNLAAQGITRSDSPSKLARALGKRLTKRKAQAGTRVAEQPPGSAGEAVFAYLREQAEQLVRLDAAVRRDEPDSVHQMRVAARRMRSALSTFRAVLDREATRPIADELRWLGAELGADRDREVQTERLYALVAGLPRQAVVGPVRGRLRTWATTRRSGTRRRVLAALNSRRHLELLASVDALLAEPPLLPAAAEPATGVLTRSVLRDYRRLAKQVAQATTDEERHEARKAAKRARYAAEAARPVLGGPAKAFATQMKRVQDVLGEYQDGFVSRETLRELAMQAHRSGESAFTYGVLYEQETARSRTAAARFDEVWAEASRKGLRTALAG